MSRTAWRYQNEDTDKVLSDQESAKADALAKRLGELDAIEERLGWAREREYEDRVSYPCDSGCDEEPQCEDGQCVMLAAFEKQRLAEQAERDVEREWLEHQLHELGLRRERAYEHWNEDERYMEYMETRYDYAY